MKVTGINAGVPKFCCSVKSITLLEDANVSIKHVVLREVSKVKFIVMLSVGESKNAADTLKFENRRNSITRPWK